MVLDKAKGIILYGWEWKLRRYLHGKMRLESHELACELVLLIASDLLQEFVVFGLHFDYIVHGDVVAIAVCNVCVKSGNRVIFCLK